MGKIAQIKSIIDEAKEIVQECKKDLVESVEEYNLKLDEFNREKEIIKSSTIANVEDVLSKIENLPENPYEPEVIDEDLEKLSKASIGDIYEVDEPKSGFFKGKFYGFIAFLLSLVAFLAIGLYMKKYNLASIDFNQWQKYIEDGFGFYGSFILQDSNMQIVGLALAIAVSFFIGYVVYLIVVLSAASTNLERAKEIFEEAKRWVEEKREFIEELKERISFLSLTNFNLKALRVFADEFESRVKRDMLFEKNDFNSYSKIAKEESITLLEIDGKLQRVVDFEIGLKDNKIANSVKAQVEELKDFVDNLKGKIYG
jgi:hypothetical protein